ncbi:hypothetical protein APSETT444_001820 [Aspergillus pseudonomiae]
MKSVATSSLHDVDKDSVPLSSGTNGTTQSETPLDNVIDVESVRSHFPVLGGETAAFNNASGTVVLKEAIESTSKFMFSFPFPPGVDAKSMEAITGCMLIVDGVACVPHRPVDVKELDVDFYCFSWYKLFGPHMGTLYASRKAQDRYMTSINHYFLSSSSLDGKLALGMPSFELQLMCSPIVSYLQDIVGWDRIVRQETVLVKILLEYLLSKPGVYRVFGRRNSDPSQRVSIVTFEVVGRSSGDVAMLVNTRNRFRITSGICLAPRPTWDVLKPVSADGLIRVSFVHYNTVEEVREFCNELDEIVTQDT